MNVRTSSVSVLLALPAQRSGEAELRTLDRRIPVRRRRDLIVTPLTLRGQRRWHIKDPITLRYWQWGDEELFLWQQLDSVTTWSSWQSAFQQRFAPRRIDYPALQGLLGMLHREGLVVSDVPGQADILQERGSQQRRQQRWNRFANPFAIRFRGINPDPFLSRLAPWFGWLFHPFAVACCLVLVLSAATLLAVEWSTFLARLPSASRFLTFGNVGWLAVTLAFVKVLHELAHGVACKRFGGECHELGVMLLVFTPCLYCNVSDTWTVPSKWQRMAVGAAGMYVECLLAALAAWLWWFTAPGLLHTLCLNVMVVCSLGTLLINGNPLLRYDGYYVLSDWLEMPNLAAEAASQITRWGRRFFTWSDGEDEPSDGYPASWLSAYAVASGMYRIVVWIVVLWAIQTWFAQQRLATLGHGLNMLAVASILIPVAMRRLAVAAPRRSARLRMGRLLAVAGLGCASAVGAFAVPMSRSTVAPAVLRPGRAHPLYVVSGGRLDSSLPAGATVRRGDVVATLVDHALQGQLLRLETDLAVARQAVESLRRQQVQDARQGLASSAGQLALAEQNMAELAGQLEQKRYECEQLVVRAPADGTLVSPARRPAESDASDLPGWSDTPLAPQNAGCTLDVGTLLGYICEGATGMAPAPEAVLAVEQSDVGELVAGQRVRLLLAEFPQREFTGRVTSIALAHAEEVPPEFLARRLVPVGVEGTGVAREAGSQYLLRVALDEMPPAPWGAAGYARLPLAPATLGSRLYHTACRVFGLVR
ncbi:MAG: site-2 protease family protein [Pirellulaceae bacterium]